MNALTEVLLAYEQRQRQNYTDESNHPHYATGLTPLDSILGVGSLSPDTESPSQ